MKVEIPMDKIVPILGNMSKVIRLTDETIAMANVISNNARIRLLPSYIAYMRICKMTV